MLRNNITKNSAGEKSFGKGRTAGYRLLKPSKLNSSEELEINSVKGDESFNIEKLRAI